MSLSLDYHAQADGSLVSESVLVWFSKLRRECFKGGTRCLSRTPVKDLSFVGWGIGRGSVFVIGICEFCCDGEDFVCNAEVVVLRRASWYLVLLAMLRSPSSDDCIDNCTSVPLFEGDTNN